jgi:hypothetical protein
MGRSSKAEVSSDAATSASSAGTAGAPAATPRPTSAGDDAQGRCATMMPMSAVAVVLAAVLLGATISSAPMAHATANYAHQMPMETSHYHTGPAAGFAQSAEPSFSSAAGATPMAKARSARTPQARMKERSQPHESWESVAMMDEGMPEMEMGEKEHVARGQTGSSDGGGGVGGGSSGPGEHGGGSRLLIRRGHLELELDRPPLRPIATSGLSQQERQAAEGAQTKAEAETAAATMNAARKAIIGIFEESGGYVESYSKQDRGSMHHGHHHHFHHHHHDGGRQQGERLDFTARVPSDRFDSIMASLRDLVLSPQQLAEGPAGLVLFESASTEDVTGQYVDAEVRPPLANLWAIQSLAAQEALPRTGGC